MTIRVCDICNNEIKDNYYKAGVYWSLVVKKGTEEKKTPYLELCEDCFDNILEKLNLERE